MKTLGIILVALGVALFFSFVPLTYLVALDLATWEQWEGVVYVNVFAGLALVGAGVIAAGGSPE